MQHFLSEKLPNWAMAIESVLNFTSSQTSRNRNRMTIRINSTRKISRWIFITTIIVSKNFFYLTMARHKSR